MNVCLQKKWGFHTPAKTRDRIISIYEIVTNLLWSDHRLRFQMLHNMFFTTYHDPQMLHCNLGGSWSKCTSWCKSCTFLLLNVFAQMWHIIEYKFSCTDRMCAVNKYLVTKLENKNKHICIQIIWIQGYGIWAYNFPQISQPKGFFDWSKCPTRKCWESWYFFAKLWVHKLQLCGFSGGGSCVSWWLLKANLVL